MKNAILKFIRDEQGATAVEYGMIAGLFAAAITVIVGKLGYSTLAEAYAAGLPYLFIPRVKFREGPPMGKFAQEVMGAVPLPEERFFSGAWLELIPGLLGREKNQLPGPNGADQAAGFILSKVTGG